MDWALVPVPLGEGGATASGLTRRVEGRKSSQILRRSPSFEARPIGLALRALSQEEPESFTAFELTYSETAES